jgi:hypothetical protein
VDKNEGAHYENRVRENAIVFTKEGGEWVMRITQDCISVNDNVSVDDAAQAVVAAIGRYLNKSKWVGLTDEEKAYSNTDYAGKCAESWQGGVEWAEAKLKEKNGG